MKSLKLFPLLAIMLVVTGTSFAQTQKTETIPVSGNCGMCKSTIEKAAKQAGATDATWSADDKALTVKYSTASTNAAKIQEKVAAAGYDTRDVKTTDAAYNKLHACCKYERNATAEKAPAAVHKCEMKDGKCDMAACKAKGHCLDCKDEADCKEKGCCKMDKSSAAAGSDAACCDKTATASTEKKASCCAKAH